MQMIMLPETKGSFTSFFPQSVSFIYFSYFVTQTALQLKAVEDVRGVTAMLLETLEVSAQPVSTKCWKLFTCPLSDVGSSLYF